MQDLVELSGLIAQEHLALKQALTDQCRMWHARRLVEMRFKRGDFSGVVQVMDAAMLEALARVLVKEMKEKL